MGDWGEHLAMVIAVLWGRGWGRNPLWLRIGRLKWHWRPDWGYVGLREGRWGNVVWEGWLQRGHYYSGRVADHTASRGAADAAGVSATVLMGDSWQDQFPSSAIGQRVGLEVPLVAELVVAMGHHHQLHLLPCLYSDLWRWLCQDLRSACLSVLWNSW